MSLLLFRKGRLWPYLPRIDVHGDAPSHPVMH
jgi:hypothetical protein